MILAIAINVDGEERFEEKQDQGKVLTVEPSDVLKDITSVIDQLEKM